MVLAWIALLANFVFRERLVIVNSIGLVVFVALFAVGKLSVDHSDRTKSGEQIEGNDDQGD